MNLRQRKREWFIAIAFGLFLFGMSTTTRAESCHVLGGCEGRVGLIRVNKGVHGGVHNGNPTYGQDPIPFASRQLFGSDSLPASGIVLTLKRSARLRYQIRSQDDRALQRDARICTVINCEEEDGGTDYLAAGTVVRIVSYQMHNHLFVLVEVIKTPSHTPNEDEQQFQFDHKEII